MAELNDENLVLLTEALLNLPPAVSGSYQKSGDTQKDAEVTIKTTNGCTTLPTQVKRIHRKESIIALAEHFSANDLLVCNRLSDFLADTCSQYHINFLDAAGNARIQTDQITLWIEGRKTHRDKIPASTNYQPGIGALKLIFVLLAHPNVLTLNYRDIAKLANISVGMVSKGIHFLAEKRLISLGSERRILNYLGIYRLWAEHYKTTLRPKLGGIKLECHDDWRQIKKEPEDTWGGEAAADLLTHYLKPEQLQLFTFLPLQKKLSQLKMRPRPDGRLWLLPAFWGQDLPISEKANAILAIAELLSDGDDRNKEVAEILYEHYIQPDSSSA